MRSARSVNFHTQDYRSNLNGVYGLCTRRVVKIQTDCTDYGRRNTKNIGCQCNITRNYTCTCRKLGRAHASYFSFPRQVYDIGIGNIKALPRRRIRKIYLPQIIDRAVGSEDLSSYFSRRSRQRLADGYYDNKSTSSKCVGGFKENENISVLSKKLSPIIQKKTGSTSPKRGSLSEKDGSSVSYNIQNDAATIPSQLDTNDLGIKRQSQEQVARNNIASNNISKHMAQADFTITRDILTPVADELNSGVIVSNSENCKDFSSESFVQHVHNLENPSDEKRSKMSVDLTESKLVGEYKKIFTSKSKDTPSIERPIPEFKSASLLRRRFEALRRGLCRKESKKESVVINKLLSYISMPSRKDVSVTTHPSHMEGQSYSNTKAADDYKAYKMSSYGKKSKDKKNKDNRQWLTDLADNEGVQGMIKPSGKKLDDECPKNSLKHSNDISRNTKQVMKSQCSSQEASKKKQGRKFFFFRNKSKEKENKLFKPKKGVTTGRCEVKDGVMIKVGGGNENHKTKKEQVEMHEKGVDQCEDSGSLRRPWLEKLVANAEDSRNNVHIRWNNKMYAPSSSTVLKLIDSVYKHTGIDFRSRSATTTNGLTNYRSFTKQRVHFMKQNIEAWMLPKTITNIQKQTNKKVYCSEEKCAKYLPVVVPSQKWFVDGSRGLSQKIEFVLHAIPKSNSSEYVIISIPDDYFSQSNSNELCLQSSDEKIYKIVEYETANFKKGKDKCHMATGDSITNEQRIINDVILAVDVGNDEYENSNISEIANKKPTLVRNISIQASNASLPKRCDVIEVGIITQRDIRDGRQPPLKLDDDLSLDESEKNIDIQNKCELADSYIQNYYRNWMSSGVELFSWHQSDSQLNSSDNNSVTSHSQGDGSKSCPKMYDDFQESTIVLSSCETSTCSHCIAPEDERKQDDSLKSKILNKFKRNCLSEAPLKSFKRDFPKDSLVVFRKRQLYACMNQKSKWRSAVSLQELNSEIKKPPGVCPRTNKPCWRLPGTTKNNKFQKKRVSLPGSENNDKLVSPLPDRSQENILSSKGSECNQKGIPSHKGTEALPKPEYDIPIPPSKESSTEKKPTPTKKNAPLCDDLCKKSSKPETLSPRKSPKAKSPCGSPPICVKPKQKKCTCLCKKEIKQTSGKDTQISPTMSKESGISLKKSPSPIPSPKSSTTIKNKNKKKDCKPNCANKRKKVSPAPTVTDCVCKNKNKISGLYLKKLAVKKNNCCDNSVKWNKDGTIHLYSQEKITIRMNRETPSTGDIQEGLNIKVQDQDGQTLYETIDYKQTDERNKDVLLKDMYQGHQIKSVSTPTIVQDIVAQSNESELKQKKSDTSVDNVIEINFTLKMKQGDKGTKVDIRNNSDIDVKKNVLQEMESQNEIYTVKEKDRAEHVNASENKKDVNIKIVIKNYNNDSDKTNEIETYAIQKTSNDNFTKGISEKFQTVSTGYSEVIDHQTFSIQRATVNMTTSTNVCEVHEVPEFVMSIESLANVARQIITSSQSMAEFSVTEQTGDSMKYDNKKKNSAEHSKAISQKEAFKAYRTEKCSIKDNNKYPAETIDQASNESTLHKKFRLRNKAHKTEILKKLFRTSSVIKKPENKRKIKHIIHTILTSDSSENDETPVASNELTYTYLGQSCFKDTDSMNNYYQLDSDFSVYKTNVHKLNPSKDDSECWVNDNAVSSQSGVIRGCLCSKLAAKLNLSNDASTDVCCCRQKIKQEREINCDTLTKDHFVSIKTCNDVEAQNSKHASNKINTTNLSTLNRNQSIVITAAAAATAAAVTVGEDKNRVPTNDVCYETDIPHFIYGNNKCCDTSFKNEKVSSLLKGEMFIPNSNFVTKSITRSHRGRLSKCARNSYATNILQLNEIKKAVLEIYAEKIVSNEGDARIVSKLPKFDVHTENNILNYVSLLKGRKRISERNIVMMSLNR